MDTTDGEVPEFIDIDGHRVDAQKADRFYHSDDGRRVSDAEWDESRRRAIAGYAGEGVVPLEILTELPEGHSFAEEVD